MQSILGIHGILDLGCSATVQPEWSQHTPQERVGHRAHPKSTTNHRPTRWIRRTYWTNSEQRTANSETKLWFVVFLRICFFLLLGDGLGKDPMPWCPAKFSISREPHNVKVERTRSPSYKLDQVGYQCRDRWGTGGHASESERVETVGNLKLNGLNGNPEHVLTVLGSSGSSNRKCTQHQTQAKHRPRTNGHKFQTKDNAAQIRETKGTMPRVQKTSKNDIDWHLGIRQSPKENRHVEEI